MQKVLLMLKVSVSCLVLCGLFSSSFFPNKHGCPCSFIYVHIYIYIFFFFLLRAAAKMHREDKEAFRKKVQEDVRKSLGL